MLPLFNSYFYDVYVFRIKKQGKKHLPTVLNPFAIYCKTH